jgi:tRNA pseudouridine38-40 synthase
VPTYRLNVEYEGTRFRGWQEQQNARSIAGELRRALTEAGGDITELGGAGRTDAGVHALAQTAHLRLRKAVDAEPFRRAVNGALPSDIHVLSVLPAADAFHARHDALSRVYLYQVSRRRAAHAKPHVWWVKREIDAARMAEGAARLVGRHDFALFCERAAEQTSTLVVLEKAEVAEAGALILVRLTASHFLWKMVRRIVGVLVRVAAGECSSDDIEMLLAGRLPPGAEEGIAQWTAPGAGLFLERVIYPGEPAMPAIAAITPVPPELPPPGMRWFTGVGGRKPEPERKAPAVDLSASRPAPASSSRRVGGKGSASGTRSGGRASRPDRRGRGR